MNQWQIGAFMLDRDKSLENNLRISLEYHYVALEPS